MTWLCLIASVVIGGHLILFVERSHLAPSTCVLSGQTWVHCWRQCSGLSNVPQLLPVSQAFCLHLELYLENVKISTADVPFHSALVKCQLHYHSKPDGKFLMVESQVCPVVLFLVYIFRPESQGRRQKSQLHFCGLVLNGKYDQWTSNVPEKFKSSFGPPSSFTQTHPTCPKCPPKRSPCLKMFPAFALDFHPWMMGGKVKSWMVVTWHILSVWFMESKKWDANIQLFEAQQSVYLAWLEIYEALCTIQQGFQLLTTSRIIIKTWIPLAYFEMKFMKLCALFNCWPPQELLPKLEFHLHILK